MALYIELITTIKQYEHFNPIYIYIELHNKGSELLKLANWNVTTNLFEVQLGKTYIYLFIKS